MTKPMTRTDKARALIRAWNLTEREADVTVCIAHGHPNDEVASDLGISPVTLKNTFLRVPAKCGVDAGGSARVRVALAAWNVWGMVPTTGGILG